MSRASRTRLAYVLSAAVHAVVLLLVLGGRPAAPPATATHPLHLHLLTVPVGEGPRGGSGMKDALSAGSTLSGVPARVLALPLGAELTPLPRPAAVPAWRARPAAAGAARPLPPTAGSGEPEPSSVQQVDGPETQPGAPGGRPGSRGSLAPGPGPGEPGGGGSGPGGLAVPGTGGGSQLGELHRRLAEAAVRCYPAAAGRLRLRGTVPVRFCLDAQGTASALSLVGTSGSALLDRSALECVVPGAEPLPALPGCFEVPVRFGG